MYELCSKRNTSMMHVMCEDVLVAKHSQ